MKRLLQFVLIGFATLPSFGGFAANREAENLILITLDGVRGKELFGGLDIDTLRASTKDKPPETTPVYQEFWAETPEARREKLMPFFWKTWMQEHGSVIGNRGLGSSVVLSNRHRFSYPGYSEILTGRAEDQIITSNDKIQNPNPTVLDFLKKQLRLGSNDVAAFASWDVMNWIVSSERGNFFSNSGYEAFEHSDDEISALSALQFEVRSPWDSVRNDAFTFRFAMQHMSDHRPRVFYLALGETDDWAHDGRYDRVLQALHQSDDYFRQLWEWLQSKRRYRNKTTILITTDHGRGDNQFNWLHHNDKLEGAKYIWLATVSPDSQRRGEWSNTETVYANQFAATMCRFMGLDYREQRADAGRAIEWLVE